MRNLKYLGGLAKNRKVRVVNETEISKEIRLDLLAESLTEDSFKEITLNLEKPKKVWVATLEVEISPLEGIRKIAIVMNASTFENADDIDYFITNFHLSMATPQWFIDTYSQRNWVEFFYREAVMMVRIKRISS